MNGLNDKAGRMPAKPRPTRRTVEALNVLFRDEWLAANTGDDFRLKLQALHTQAVEKLPTERPV
jgi:hypothetical protein